MTDKSKDLVSNPIAEAVPTKISTVGLGAAMSQLDLSSVPEHRRQEAVMDHFFRVMSENVMDTKLSEELKGSRAIKEKRQKPNSGIAQVKAKDIIV